jgi:hypothetical protein
MKVKNLKFCFHDSGVSMTSLISFRMFARLNADLIRIGYIGRCSLSEVYLMYATFCELTVISSSPDWLSLY